MSPERIPDCPHGVAFATVKDAWDAEYDVEQRAALEACSCCRGPIAPGAKRCRTCLVEVQTHG